MGITTSMTGSGEFGEISPGWSISEYATPSTIGETAEGSGSVSFSAKTLPTTKFVVNNNITTTAENLGQVSGIIKTVSRDGIGSSITHNTVLAQYDAERHLPEMIEASPHTCLDMINQVIGKDIRLKSGLPGNFWSLAGHIAGFNSEGVQTEFKEYFNTFASWDSQGNPTTQTAIINRDSPYCLRYSYINNKVWADNVYGDTLPLDQQAPVARIAWKAVANGDTSTAISLEGLPDSSNISSGFNIAIGVDFTTEEAFISGEYRYGGMLTNVDQRLDISELNLVGELAIFVKVNNETITPANPYNWQLSINVCNTSDYSIVKTLNWTMETAAVAWMRRWYISGYTRALWTRYDNAADLIQEWENPESFIVSEAITSAPLPTRGAVGGIVNMWQYLQDACSAFKQELAVVNDVIHIRPLGERIVDITNHAANISFSQTATLSGTSIDINYTDSQGTTATDGYSFRSEIYNAYTDSNRIITVNSGETISTTIETDYALISVLKPRKMTSSSTFPNTLGRYHICDDSGAYVTSSEWTAYGGDVDAVINPDNPKAINVILKGPYTEIPGKAGPYSMAYGSGTNKYAALSVQGTGIKIESNVLSLQTGADPAKTPKSSAKTIDNRFISKLEQAYDAGIGASILASGPRVEISGNIPVSSVNGVGLVAGSLIYYEDSIYRIKSCTIGNLNVSFTAERYVTVGDFDTKWTGRTVSSHDSTWSGYDVQDQIIAPLFMVGDDESIIMSLDTDVNPYYDFIGEPEISVFQDSDANPYYEDGGNLEGEDTILLDTDQNPYDGDL